jgi:ATP-dependent helicase YprA (DUF1998 family)
VSDLPRYHTIGKQNGFVALPVLPALVSLFTSWCKQEQEEASRLSATDTAACMLGGVCLTVSPLLVLGSDQSSKLKTIMQAGTGIKVAHLDEIAAGSVQEINLLQDIEKLPSHRRKTTSLLFSSPQRLGSESWAKQLPRVIQAKVLKMVCVDEAHIYVMH